MITEAHLHLRLKTKVRSAHVYIRYMWYAVQVATETDKTTYYPEEIDRMEKRTRRRDCGSKGVIVFM